MSSTSGAQGVVDDVKDAVTEQPVSVLARVGLAARGLVYLLLGVLAFAVALGSRSTQVDQKGVLTELLSRPLGGFLVALLALGFACYAVWRFYEAATGVPGTGRRAWPRAQSGFRGLVYAFLTFTAIAVLLGSRQSQGAQQKGVVAEVMSHEGGRWLVLLVGLAVVVVGLTQIYEGTKRKFMRWFPAGALPPEAITFVRRLGTVGTISRGVVFALAGALVVVAAWSSEPSKAGGVDSAVTSLRGLPYGPFLIAVIAVGLIAFGLFGLAEARYRRVAA